MPSNPTLKTTLEGNFKKIVADKLLNHIPSHVVLARGVGEKGAMIKWASGAKKTGDHFAIPTLVKGNQSYSYLGDTDSDATFEDTNQMITKEAQIKAFEGLARGRLSYRAAEESATSSQAFESAWSLLAEDLQTLAYNRIEIQALHGQNGLGVVESVGAPVGQFVDVVLTNASFAPGMWPTLEGAKVETFNTALSAKANTGLLTINSVNTDTRTLNIEFVGGLASQIVATNVIYFKGAVTAGGTPVFKEFAGLYKQLAAQSGTLLNIDRSLSVMKGNVLPSVGKISKGKVLQALKKCHDKGATGKFVLLVSTESAIVLQEAEMAARRYDSSYKSKAEVGNTGIEYTHGPSTVVVTPHPMVKNGEALLFKPEECYWVGATKPTFEGPNGEYFQFIADKPQVELQNYSLMAIYAEAPSHACVMTGIDNA